MYLVEINKKSLSGFDDKRYILEDGIRTIPHADPVTSFVLNLFSNVEQKLNKNNVTK